MLREWTYKSTAAATSETFADESVANAAAAASIPFSIPNGTIVYEYNLGRISTIKR